MSDPAQHPVETILDTCAVLSLYATRRMAEILSAMPGQVAICDLVAGESLYVHRVIDGERVRTPVDLAPFVEAGILAVVTADTDDELQTFVDLALHLDDGEAMTAALAIHRGCVLVTDDRKAERLLVGRVRLRATLDIVKGWADGEWLEGEALKEIVAAIYDRGYQPPIRHPLRFWWDSAISGVVGSPSE